MLNFNHSIPYPTDIRYIPETAKNGQVGTTEVTKEERDAIRSYREIETEKYSIATYQRLLQDFNSLQSARNFLIKQELALGQIELMSDRQLLQMIIADRKLSSPLEKRVLRLSTKDEYYLLREDVENGKMSIDGLLNFVLMNRAKPGYGIEQICKKTGVGQ
jgi:hypothetical protein